MKFLLSASVVEQKINSLTLTCGILLMLVLETHGWRVESSYLSKLEPVTVPICENKTYCEDTPHYPTEIVIRMLKENPHLYNYENVDEIYAFSQEENKSEEEPLCVSMEQIVFPKSGETKSSGWKFIVNHESFKQSVRIEKCLEEGKTCRVIEGFAEGYHTMCVQKYIYRQLLAVADNGSLYRESFRFPASCCCHIDFQAGSLLKSSKAKI